MRPIVIQPAQARRFSEEAVGLVRGFASVGEVIARLGYVQLDPIQVCGRMHDLNLRNRVAGYAEGDLVRHVHAVGSRDERTAFEHYVPGRGILVVFPITAWPMIHAVLRARRTQGAWSARKLSAAEEKVASWIVGEIRERGPLTSDQIEHEGLSVTAWGTLGRAAKNILEAMFHRGDVLISGRRNFRRVYDLPERVIPAAWWNKAPVDDRELGRWLALTSLQQWRLVTLRRREWELVEDQVQPVQVDSARLLYCLRGDVDVLESAGSRAAENGHARLLAPLDPLIYHREVTRRLWDFDYTWEVYTPPAKRVRGYYALPVLSRGELVGHIEPRADRSTGRLQVVSRRVRRGHGTKDAVRELARFLGLRA